MIKNYVKFWNNLEIPVTKEEDFNSGLDRFVSRIKNSENLMWQYNNISMNDGTVFDLSNFSVNKLRLYYGELKVAGINLGHDSVVPLDDMYSILNSVNSSDKEGWGKGSGYGLSHTELKNHPEIKELIKRELLE